MFYEPGRRDRSVLPHDPFKALVAPRPIGWVATRGRSGAVNLAPYSFFNAFNTSPPILGFASEGAKDSVTFARETGEFVWNLATYALRDAMNATSAPLPRGSSEFERAGLAQAPCRLVSPPRVAASPCAMECKVTDIVELKGASGAGLDTYLVLGEVIGVHLDERFLHGGKIDTQALQPLTRCGANEYALPGTFFAMDRPRA